MMYSIHHNNPAWRLSIPVNMSESRSRLLIVGLILVLNAIGSPRFAVAQETGRKELTVERIYSTPSLSGRLTRGLAWRPDGEAVSFFEAKGAGKEAKTELWLM